MKVTKLHAFFKVADDSYNAQKLGFTVEIDDNDNITEIVDSLREKALDAIGKTKDNIYKEKNRLRVELHQIETKLEDRRREWDAMAEFLKAQGIKPDATPMPQFQNLLMPEPVAEFINAEEVEDEDYNDDEYEDEDDY